MPRPVFFKLAPSESECESKIVFPRKEQMRRCTENTVACSARIDTVTAPEPREIWQPWCPCTCRSRGVSQGGGRRSDSIGCPHLRDKADMQRAGQDVRF